MNDTFMKEKPVFPLIHVHGPANGHLDARKFSVQYRGQFLCRTDQ